MKGKHADSLLRLLVFLGMAISQGGCVSHSVTLTAKTLYQGYDARYVVLAENDSAVRFDPRLLDTDLDAKAWIITDPVDLHPSDGVLCRAGQVHRVRASIEADVPGTAGLAVHVRGTQDGLCPETWTAWEPIETPRAVFRPPGRFVQFRITLTAGSHGALPSVRRLRLIPEFEAEADWQGRVSALNGRIPQPACSPIAFHYARPDHPDIRWFRKVAELDKVVAGRKGDFEKLVALADYIGALPWKPSSPRIRGSGGRYEWDIRKTIEVRPDGTLALHGHCMSYSEAMVTACVALGYVSARHCAILGFREASHEVVEVWVPDRCQWVYLDPTMTQYYYDKQTRRPLNLLEMHDIVAAHFVPDGKDMAWFSDRTNRESRAAVRRVGGKNPIGARTGAYQFGKRTDGNYDWGWLHGYLAAGFVQMTPRNDFQQHPEAVPDAFEHYPGYADYPNWVDMKTPPRPGGEHWFTRKRDFYWSLDQASCVLTKKEEPELEVRLTQTMPFFDHYEIVFRTTVGERKQTLKRDGSNRMAWQLSEGSNEMRVIPVDEFGRRGLCSSLQLRYAH